MNATSTHDSENACAGIHLDVSSLGGFTDLVWLRGLDLSLLKDVRRRRRSQRRRESDGR